MQADEKQLTILIKHVAPDEVKNRQQLYEGLWIPRQDSYETQIAASSMI